jgi:hypothetical protein
MDEIAAERGCDARHANTQDQLGELVRAARAESARGDVLLFDPSDRSKVISRTTESFNLCTSDADCGLGFRGERFALWLARSK